MNEKKFISIVWGYHKQIFSFDKKQNYHMLPIEVMKSQGFDCELFAIDSQVVIEEDPNIIPGLKIVYYTGILQYLKYLWKNRKCVIYSNSLTIKTLLVGLFGKKTIFMAHDQVLPLESKRIKRMIVLFFYRFFTKIRAINQGESELLNSYGISNFVLPIAISDEFYESNLEGRKDMVFLGNLTYDKNPVFLLNALFEITKEYPNILLHIFGEDRYKDAVGNTFTEIIKKMGLENSVVMHGFMPHSYIKDFLKKTLIFVNASLSEGQCLAVFEAALSGCALCLPSILSFPSVFGEDAKYHSTSSELAKNVLYYLENKEAMTQSILRNQKLILSKYNYEYLKEQTLLHFDIA